MTYRTFGRLAFAPSALGFGCMRLPLLADGSVDEPLAITMLRAAIDAGVSYVDTAYGYHGGHSERVLGLALRDGYRARVAVATKLPCWLVHTRADADRLLAEQLARLGCARVDCYLLHNLHAATWDRLRALGITDWLAARRAEGTLGAVGFSFHDDYDTLARILDEWDGWDLCQLQYNYVCEEVQAGTRGLRLAHERGLGVVVMEPLFGGVLADPPEPMAQLFAAAGAQPADLALRWLWDQPEVSVVLSGMSAPDQVAANLASADRARVGGLSAAEHDLIAAAAQAYEQARPIPCTRCAYCQPCPQGVNIPVLFDLYNTGQVLSRNPLGLARNLYAQLPGEQRADRCLACGECEDQCPQHIAVREWLPRVHESLGGV
jgi:predicted aldo/keto reductase-like oxidoreductase